MRISDWSSDVCSSDLVWDRRRKKMNKLLSAFLLVLATTASAANAQPREAVEGLSGLKIPRFVSLSSGQANLRTGPGDRYPVNWIYQRKDLPLKVVKEYGIWRQVVDPDGDTEIGRANV